MGDTPDVLKRIVTKKWEEWSIKNRLNLFLKWREFLRKRLMIDGFRRCN